MEQLLSRIITTLDETQRLYQDLMMMVQQERKAVLNSSVDQLSELLIEKENLLSQLTHLEKRRMGQLKQMAGQLHMPTQSLTLSKLAAQSPPHYAQKINERRTTLRRLIGDIGKVNEENRSMTHHCLSLVQGSLQFLQHWITPPSIYGASGSIDDRTKSGHLLSGTV